ncbi:SIMPL domain-containing protein [Paracoccus sp. MC1854]|uniref:SIMPL domain-containing protein n=1 Tax=Paracoccus sp. MC1854 TaxID=2760306 RepID=UPI0016049430|nr:SIMPL domain-containing protein [Paracoccus sp. MC1854]MBB1491804.1 SIMPL domain-containing protein [Paracoccus sp. MC1854]
MAQTFSLIPAALAGTAALALTAWPVSAHPAGHGCGKPATINVQGEGRASVAPDLATVSLGVTTQAPTAAQAMADNAARQTAVIEALRAQGVAPADLQTQGLNLSPIQDYSREGQPPVITGYQAQNIVTARIRDLPRLGEMLDAMVGAGATDVQGIGFSREDAAATEDRARTAAVTEARRRAGVIADAAGMEVGPLVSLTDTSMSGSPRLMAMMARAAEADASTPVETGELTLTAQVTGVWTLLPAGGTADCGPGKGRGHHHGKMPGKGHGPGDGHHSGMMDGHRHGEGMPPEGEGRPAPPVPPQAAGEPAGSPGWSLAPQPAPLSPSDPAGAVQSAPAAPPVSGGQAAPQEPAPQVGGTATPTNGTDAATPDTGDAASVPPAPLN